MWGIDGNKLPSIKVFKTNLDFFRTVCGCRSREREGTKCDAGVFALENRVLIPLRLGSINQGASNSM